MIAEKHPTSELIRRQLAGLSLEDPEPEPLIKREKGKWKGIENFNSLFPNNSLTGTKKSANNSGPTLQLPNTSATINTLKTTLAHKNSSESSSLYNSKFKNVLIDNLKFVDKIEKEMMLNSTKWTNYWQNSIIDINKLYNNNISNNN
jgi:hypothetical protein